MNYLISFIALSVGSYCYFSIRQGSNRIVRLIYAELIFNLFIKYIIGYTAAPSLLNYLTDVILLLMIAEHVLTADHRNIRVAASLIISVAILGMIALISYIHNLYSPFLFLWGVRNNFRFLIFAIICSIYLKKEDIDIIMRILYLFLVVNFFVVLYQFNFVSYPGYSIGDYISGLFSNGMQRGGNTSLLWLMCIVCTYEIIRYLNGLTSAWRPLFSIALSAIMSALGEIKLFFVLILIIGFLALALCKKSARSAGFFLMICIGVISGINLLYLLFPQFSGFFQNTEDILSYLTSDTGYTGSSSTAVNRLTVFSYVFRNFLLTADQRILGLGLGNADYSSFQLLTSDFYLQYAHTGYMYFSSSAILVELGIAGLVSYILYYMNYLRLSIIKKAETSMDVSVKQMGFVISLMSIFMIFFNQSLKMEASAYMVTAVLVMPVLSSMSEQDDSVTKRQWRKLRIIWR